MLAPGWAEHKNDKGQIYYYNHSTAESSWTKPTAELGSNASEKPLARGWSRHVSNKGKEYYYNSKTKETTWTRPVDEESSSKPVIKPDSSAQPVSKELKPPSGASVLLKASVNTVIAANKVNSVAKAAAPIVELVDTVPIKLNAAIDSSQSQDVNQSGSSSVENISIPEVEKPVSTSIYDIAPTASVSKPTPTKPALNAALLRRKSTSTVNNAAVSSYITAASTAKADKDKYIKKKLKSQEGADDLSALEEQGLYELYTVPTSNGKNESSSTVLARKGSVSWRNRIPNPPTMSEFTKKRAESAPEMLSRLLIKNEIVDAQFDCYYPNHAPYPWYITILLIFCTLGGYGVVLLVRWCLNSCCTAESRNKICSANGTCSFPVYFRRMKMSITNKGRIILWSLEGSENCECGSCGLRSWFSTRQNVKILTTSQIRQVSQSFESSTNPICCCCCGTHQGSIDIYFNAFQQDHESSFLKAGTISDFYTKTKAFVSDIVHHFSPDTTQSGGSTGTSGNTGYWDRNDMNLGNQKSPLLIRVVASSMDHVYKNDTKGMLDELSELQATLLAFMPETPKDPWTNCSLMDATSSTDANVTFKESLEGLTLVDNNGDINLPAKFVPFTEGEVLISAVGQMKFTTACDKFLSLLSCSLYYWFKARYRKFERSVLILTNKRIIEVNMYQRIGKIPENLKGATGFTLQIRSLFPGDIYSGYLFLNENNIAESSLHTEGGNITVFVPGSKIHFGRKVQRVNARSKPLITNFKLLPDKFQSTSDKPVKKAAAPKSPKKNAVEGENDSIEDLESGLGTANATKLRRRDYNSVGKEYSLHDSELDSRALDNVPLMDHENVVYRFKGSPEWRPCWVPTWFVEQLYLLFCCRSAPPYNCMFTSSWGRNIWRPCAACITCGFRPRKKLPEIVITSTTLYYNSSFYSNPICDCGAGSGVTTVPRGYFISWIPLRSLNDQEVDINMHGSFNVNKCTCCGIYGCIAPQTPTADQVNKGENTASYCNFPLPHCPVYSSYQLKLGTLEGFSYRLHSIAKDHNWLKDFKLSKMQAILGVIQSTIMDEHEQHAVSKIGSHAHTSHHHPTATHTVSQVQPHAGDLPKQEMARN